MTHVATILASLCDRDELIHILSILSIPYCCIVLSYIVPVVALEYVVRQPWARKYHIIHGKANERWDGKKHKLPESAWGHDSTGIKDFRFVCINAAVAVVVFHVLERSREWGYYSETERTVVYGIGWSNPLEYVAFFVLADFVAYACHYACHKNDFLWRHVHAHHHTEHTPTAVSSGVLSFGDTLATTSIPYIMAATILKPNLIVIYAGMSTFTASSVNLHCGMDLPYLTQLLGLGVVPFRATPVLHDFHHKAMGRAAMDVGHHLWIWDWMFGTMTQRSAEYFKLCSSNGTET
eukprot:CAMPEP_0119559160 /NCGR_PEP_ID=MMETSP1352-20130426/12026_1 /TAXON_ID=265584 /ORGANISM="Stauroneis constricta, Strain CCMP1120" /LENGTH=292 /DNA_ID=CAMNT_0007606771 /DNA_START=108 /DNA_END=982 /DNA_ORIENTATION=-